MSIGGLRFEPCENRWNRSLVHHGFYPEIGLGQYRSGPHQHGHPRRVFVAPAEGRLDHCFGPVTKSKLMQRASNDVDIRWTKSADRAIAAGLKYDRARSG